MLLKFSFLLIVLQNFSIAQTQNIELSQIVQFKVGDSYRLNNFDYSIAIEYEKGGNCAVPNFNCGAGYNPPGPRLKINCGSNTPCPFVTLFFSSDSTSGKLSIENLKSCEINQPEICFREFAREFKNDLGCMKISNLEGRYYCLKNFENSKLIENKNICDQLPLSVFALRWNCFYEYAIRYNDVSFCEKYKNNEISGKNRCLLKMAEINKDVKICSKIIKTSEDRYLEQCLNYFKVL